jgi:hypothetical protein
LEGQGQNNLASRTRPDLEDHITAVWQRAMKFYMKMGVDIGNKAPENFPDGKLCGFKCPKRSKNVKIVEMT